ncbi:MAG: hypothetical protein Q9224_001458 [Gallowayella concinna]
MPGTVSDADLALLSHPHNYYNNPPSNAWKVSVTDSIGLSLVTIVVAARCFTKLRITKALGWEDFISVLTWIMFIAFSTLNFVQRFRFGGGRHTWDLPPEFYNGFLRTSTSSSYLYMLGTMLAKISLLLFLYRIFSVDRKFRIAAWALGTILVGWTIISFFLRIFACRPIKASWDVKLQLDPETRCNPKSYNTLNVHGICNIITDFGLLLLPVPMVWKLQMSLKKKLGVAAVFASGAILSIVVSCLPALAPFFRQFSVLASLIPSSIRSKFSSHSGSSEKRGQPWAAHKLPGSSTQSDVERGAVRSEEHKPHSSWRVPRAWHERSYDDYDRRSETSEMTLQPVLPTNREIKHGD